MSLFESAAHSRLVVYNETLDDPEGIVHIRDLLAFMTAKAHSPRSRQKQAKDPFPAGLDLRAVDLALPACDANIIRKLLFVPPSMRAIDLLAQMQASRKSIWALWWMNMAAPTVGLNRGHCRTDPRDIDNRRNGSAG